MKNSSKRPKKILFLSLSGIGNFLMHSPTWQTLKRENPDYHITVWVAPRGTKALALNDESIDQVIEAPIKNSIMGHLKLINQLRKEKYDTGIVLSPGQLIKSAAYLKLSNIPNRIGHTYPLKNNPNSSLFLTESFDEVKNLHDIKQNLSLIRSLQSSKENVSSANYHLTLPLTATQNAQEALAKLKLDNHPLLIGIHPGSAKDFLWKRWSSDNFITLAKKLIDKYQAKILIFGGPDEIEVKQTIKDALRLDSQIITADLLTTTAIMNKCRFIVSNDSGLMHLAAAAGTMTFGIFGPTDERLTGPRGEKSYVIRAPQTKPVYNTESNFNLGQKPHESLEKISPDLALEYIRKVI